MKRVEEGAKAKPKAKRASHAGRARKTAAKAKKGAKVMLLSGGNPQIGKGDGAPVQAYIAAMPGWKRDVGRRLDKLIARTVPGVKKAIKWNSPFYGVEDGAWFLSFHCFPKYVKVAFFRGALLRPVPPGASTQKDVRYLDIHEDDELDEAQFARWVKQASRLHGERLRAASREVCAWRDAGRRVNCNQPQKGCSEGTAGLRCSPMWGSDESART